MSKLIIVALGVAIAVFLGACEGTDEIRLPPLTGGNAEPPPSNPSPFPIPYPITAQETKREQHAVTKRELCEEMERRFRQQGRQVELVEIQRILGNDILRWNCVFEGPDADPNFFEPYQDR